MSNTNNKDNFVSLHTHSEYSNIRLLDSTNKIKDMILHVANNLNQSAMALTDHESIAGHPQYLQTVEELKGDGLIPLDFKPILGNEIYLVDQHTYEEAIENNNSMRFYHFLLLAKNKEGHRQLRELSSRAWERERMLRGMERTPTYYSDIEEIIGGNKGNIIASTACLGSRFAQLALKYAQYERAKETGEIDARLTGAKVPFHIKVPEMVSISPESCDVALEQLGDELHEFISWCVGIFGEDFYIEVQPSEMEDQIMYNKVAQRIATAYNIPMIITTDAHYLTKADRPVHESFLTSDSDGESNREVADFYSTTYFFTTEELLASLGYLGVENVQEMVENTHKIAIKCEFYSLAHNQVIPKIPLPPEEEWDNSRHGEIYEALNKIPYHFPSVFNMFYSEEPYDRYLVHQCFNGMVERVPVEDYPEYLARLNIEFEEILGVSEVKKEPISSYFITMQKIIDIIWETGSIVGTGRGSAGCFLTNYLLQIVQINPLRQGVKLEHWRFLHKSKIEIPDIDIDLSSHKRDIVFKALQRYFQSIGGDIVRVCTYGTETAKSALQTAIRGLGLNNDIGTYLSSLMPVERGQVWSLTDAYYGNPDKEREPVTELVNQIDQYEGLLEVALGVEGLISRRGVHACGALVVNEPITGYNAIMRAPNGEVTTQYTLAPSEYTGLIKYDLLNTKTCGMIQICMEMLIEHGHMEWQGSLRATYDKYLHPDVIDSTSFDMWERLCNHELISAFQMDGDTGQQAVEKIKPHSIIEASNANTVMRLMCEGLEQPLDKYARYKHDINEWYKDMREYGLTEEEIKILEPLLLHDSGVCGTQESMMSLVMDENISAFDVPQANLIRKVVAKKKMKDIPKIMDLFYSKGAEVGSRSTFLDYIWHVQISMQLGYSFCLAHALEYTWILVQQLNLIHYYPSIYWATAVLLVESGAVSQDTESDEDDKKEKTTNYGVVASAISDLQQHGVVIDLPNINKADVGFTPHEDTNSIMFGFKGVSSINNETASIIIENRPFASLDDFHKRMVEVKREVTLSTGKRQNKSLVSSTQTINLIKAGAFDELEQRPRAEILEGYLRMLFPPKKTMTTANINAVMELGIIPSEYQPMLGLFNFKKFVSTLPKHNDETSKTVKWHTLYVEGDDELTDYTTNFFHENFGELQEGRDYYYDDYGYVNVALGTSRKGSLDAVLKEKIKPFTDWLNSPACIDTFNYITFEAKKQEIMQGNQSRWEMESMNYYYSEHELASIDKEKYGIVNFYDLPEEPEVVGFTQHGKNQYPKFALSRICGTVLDRDKNKHTITLLTEYGVVTLKMYSGQFSFYDKTISANDEETGKKVTLEESWFKRGSKLLVTGFRRGAQMRVKRYQNTVYQHAICKITDIDEYGNVAYLDNRVELS